MDTFVKYLHVHKISMEEETLTLSLQNDMQLSMSLFSPSLSVSSFSCVTSFTAVERAVVTQGFLSRSQFEI